MTASEVAVLRSVSPPLVTTSHSPAGLASPSMVDISSSDLGNVVSFPDPLATLLSHEKQSIQFNNFDRLRAEGRHDFPISTSRTAASFEQPHVLKPKPIGDSLVSLPRTVQRLTLSRQDTLVPEQKTTATRSDKTSADLKVLLGNTQSKLRSGAKLLRTASTNETSPEYAVPLERNSSRSRVELDLFLDNELCVQGGTLKGSVEIRVKKHKSPIFLSAGKLRVVGFESILDDAERATFYHCARSLAAVASGTHSLHTTEADDEGFARTLEGVYVLPFAIHVPLTTEFGIPKGPMPSRSGASIRYVTMVSFRVKHQACQTTSIAHFYRECNLWPRLDPSTILVPAPIPMEARSQQSVVDGKTHLTLTLHRLYWVAGQFCHVQIHVTNNSKKALKNVALELLESTTTFKPGFHRDSRLHGREDLQFNACQVTTINRKVAESILPICKVGAAGHASARGWWSGVSPGRSQTFLHSIFIPPHALTISRGKLIEVSYMLQAVVNSKSSSADSRTAVPLQIVNFLSLDPPPNFA